MIPNESISKTTSKTKNFTPIELVRPTILLNILADLMVIFYHPLRGYATEFLDTGRLRRSGLRYFPGSAITN